MRERPIIFSGPMVRAILEGRKTETRRLVRGVPKGITEVHNWGALDPLAEDPQLWGFWGCEGFDSREPHNCYDFETRCPYGEPGDRLWVKEGFLVSEQYPIHGAAREVCVRYRAEPDGFGLWFDIKDTTPWQRYLSQRWRSSRYMPRWASRILLEVTGVRAERLQEIGERGARAEGVTMARTWRQAFVQEWDRINSKRAPWESNPWVWVVQFARSER